MKFSSYRLQVTGKMWITSHQKQIANNQQLKTNDFYE